MNSFKFILIILVIFFKTGNVLSQNKLFNVNNIEITNKSNGKIEVLAERAIKQGFEQLIQRILLDEDTKRIKNLSFPEIKELVSYYQVKDEYDENTENKKIFNIFFDKDKLHALFFRKEISYSDIYKEELYLLPILKKNDQIFIYSKNFFYEKWNEFEKNELVDFVLPLENIETIQRINFEKNNLSDLKIKNIFEEYSNKNIALIIIQDSNSNEEKVFIKARITGKNINKNYIIQNENLEKKDFYKKIILDIRREITKIIKSQNLIDVRTPSFINTKLEFNKKNNLVELNKRTKEIDLIENIYIQELNNKYILLKIKYFGKISKIIEELKNQKIILKLKADQWSLEII